MPGSEEARDNPPLRRQHLLLRAGRALPVRRPLPKVHEESANRIDGMKLNNNLLHCYLIISHIDIHRDVNISDLSSVDINWKMLTLARPANKTDEEIFSKYGSTHK